jgi:hypothetical protein
MADTKDSQRQEKELAKKLDGTVNAGSGNQWLRKSDVRTGNELFELKITSAKSYSLKDAELEKNYNQALMDGRIPIFMVEFKTSGNSWVIMSKDDYLELREKVGFSGNETT